MHGTNNQINKMGVKHKTTQTFSSRENKCYTKTVNGDRIPTHSNA